jgi:hypothetical protein
MVRSACVDGKRGEEEGDRHALIHLETKEESGKRGRKKRGW